MRSRIGSQYEATSRSVHKIGLKKILAADKDACALPCSCGYFLRKSCCHFCNCRIGQLSAVSHCELCLRGMRERLKVSLQIERLHLWSRVGVQSAAVTLAELPIVSGAKAVCRCAIPASYGRAPESIYRTPDTGWRRSDPVCMHVSMYCTSIRLPPNWSNNPTSLASLPERNKIQAIVISEERI